MKYIDTEIKKICGLYVNEWHLTTMILPYIHKTIKEKNKVITILENGIKDNILELLSKMNLDNKLNEKILEINWTSNKTCKYEEIKHQIQEQNKEIKIIVKGTTQYIKNANRNIEKLINEIKPKEVTIINCYDVSKYKNVNEILKQYEYIINTAGIRKVEEVFKLKNEKIDNVI